ncbi:MAG TPA: CAP domain-containing protein [Burkholderiales bacterium]|nr:CAP domain-containing protein [Burkholderiales bacterium]
MLRAPTVIAILAALAACAPAPQRQAPAAKPAAPAPAPEAAEPRAAAGVTVSGIEQQVIARTNAFRRQNALAALEANARLTAIAQSHVRNMARQDKFGDTDQNGHVLDGADMEDRIRAGGYAFALVAENVGYQLNRGEPVAAMMDGWKNSPGHRRNLLLAQVTEIGVGAAKGRSGRWYFVQLFGRPPQVTKISQ